MLVIDLETTGLNSTDKIIEIAIGDTIKQDIIFHAIINHPKKLIENCFIVGEHPELLQESLKSEIQEEDLHKLLEPYLNQSWTAFNVSFEFPFLSKYGFEYPEFCLMLKMKPICAIPHEYYGIKYPKLAEAYYHIKGHCDFVFHRAKGDVLASIDIYNYLVKEKKIEE